MRIISGKFGGRRFYPPADKWPTRPTTDIAKEGLYNILQNWIYFEAEIFLDLFGGTGNHCYEFISRGCRDATYVDRHRPAVSFVRKTAKELQIESELTIYAMRSEEHTSELQSRGHLVCRLLLEKTNRKNQDIINL